MTNRKEVDEAAKKRIAEVFARLPAGEPVPPPAVLASSASEGLDAPRVDGEALRVIEALGRGGWRAWLIRRLAGI